MGQCGCGDFHADMKFRGPDDHWYILQFYPSCDHCDNPAGLIIYRLSLADSQLWYIDSLPETEITPEGSFFPLLHPHFLKNQMLTWLEEADPRGNEYEPAGAIEDGIDAAFREAIFETLEASKKGELP